MIADIFKKLVISGADKTSRKQLTAPMSSRSYHVFIFVHGFQASSYDMRAIKN